jgi:NADH-quinone oxidoreductase subunit H
MTEFFNFLWLIVYIIVSFLGIILPLLLAVAFLTLAERKVLASMQRRKGPNCSRLFRFVTTFSRWC